MAIVGILSDKGGMGLTDSQVVIIFSKAIKRAKGGGRGRPVMTKSQHLPFFDGSTNLTRHMYSEGWGCGAEAGGIFGFSCFTSKYKFEPNISSISPSNDYL